jgi:hypothetical protein
LSASPQREAQSDALRKVRGELDRAGADEIAALRFKRRIFLMVAILLVPLLFLLAAILVKPKDFQGPPIVLPSAQEKS